MITFLSCSLEGERSFIIENFEQDLVLWLDGSDVNGDGSATSHLDPITTWVDKSDSGNDADGTASSPIYQANSLNSLGTISFAEAEWLDVDLGILDSPTTIVVLCYFDYLAQPGGNDDYVISMGTNVANSHLSIGRYRGSGNTNEYFVFTGGSNVYGPIITGNLWTLITQSSIDNPTYHHLKINGTSQVVPDFSAAIDTNGEMGIGYNRSNTNNHLLGNIAEILVYNRELSSTEISAIENYLTIKWGL